MKTSQQHLGVRVKKVCFASKYGNCCEKCTCVNIVSACIFTWSTRSLTFMHSGMPWIFKQIFIQIFTQIFIQIFVQIFAQNFWPHWPALNGAHRDKLQLLNKEISLLLFFNPVSIFQLSEYLTNIGQNFCKYSDIFVRIVSIHQVDESFEPAVSQQPLWIESIGIMILMRV